MVEIILLSDTHNRFDILPALKKKYPNALFIVTGDITDNGKKDEYRRAEMVLSDWFYLPVPGNHCYGFAGNVYSKKSARMFDERLCRHWDGQRFFHKRPAFKLIETKAEKILVIGLNSCLKTKHPFDFASGRIGLKQRLILKLLLWKNGGCIKIVALHHHPFIHTNPLMWLQDGKKLMRLLCGKVDMVVFGHKHKRRAWSGEYNIRHILASGSAKADKQFDRDLWRIEIIGKFIRINEISTLNL